MKVDYKIQSGRKKKTLLSKTLPLENERNAKRALNCTKTENSDKPTLDTFLLLSIQVHAHTHTHTHMHTHTHTTPHQGTVRLQCVPKHYIPESRDVRLLHSTATKHSVPPTLSVKGTRRPVCWLSALQNSYPKSYSAFLKGTTITAMTQNNHNKSFYYFFTKPV